MNDYMKAKRETRGNKNGNKTSEWEQYTQYTRLKRNAYYKIFNIFLRRNQVHLDWKDILLLVEVPPWVSPLCLVPEKRTIWHLGLSRSPGNKFLRFFESKYKYCIFLYGLHFTKKFLLLLTIQGFFSKFTALQPLQQKWYFLLIFISWYIELCK